jgi:hypothetical protein
MAPTRPRTLCAVVGRMMRLWIKLHELASRRLVDAPTAYGLAVVTRRCPDRWGGALRAVLIPALLTPQDRGVAEGYGLILGGR